MLHEKIFIFFYFSVLHYQLLQVVLVVSGRLRCSVRWHCELGEGGRSGHDHKSKTKTKENKSQKLPAEEIKKQKAFQYQNTLGGLEL